MGPTPTIQRPTPPPTIDQAKVQSDQADLIRKRQGAAATFVSTNAGRQSGGVATKALLGQGG